MDEYIIIDSDGNKLEGPFDSRDIAVFAAGAVFGNRNVAVIQRIRFRLSAR